MVENEQRESTVRRAFFSLSLFSSMPHFMDCSKRCFNANEDDKEYNNPADQVRPYIGHVNNTEFT